MPLSLDELWKETLIRRKFDQLYKKFPFRFQVDKEELKSKVLGKLDPKDSSALLGSFIDNQLFELKDNYLMQHGNQRIESIYGRAETRLVEEILLREGLNVKSVSQIGRDISVEPDQIEEIESFLVLGKEKEGRKDRRKERPEGKIRIKVQIEPLTKLPKIDKILTNNVQTAGEHSSAACSSQFETA